MSAAEEEFRELMRDKEQRTRHPEDDIDARSFLNLSDNDDDGPSPAPSNFDPDTETPRPSMNALRHVIPSRRYAANTGPKGVISDAQDFRDSRRAHQSMRNLHSRAQSLTLDEPVHVPMQELDEDDDLEDEDDGFMQNWRQSRLQELQKKPRDSKMHLNGQSRRHYGGLTPVDGDGYLDAVDNSGPHTAVVVYIYDDFSQVSDLFEDCVRTLAAKHVNTRFVKLHYEDAEMEPAGVPAIIAYRGGDKFADMVPVINELPDDADLSALTLEAVMKRQGILE